MTTTKESRIIDPNALLCLDLQRLQKENEELASDWNGKDDTFMSGGDIYHEDDAYIANDIAEACENLIELLEGQI